jgi:hypothetical protein
MENMTDNVTVTGTDEKKAQLRAIPMDLKTVKTTESPKELLTGKMLDLKLDK